MRAENGQDNWIGNNNKLSFQTFSSSLIASIISLLLCCFSVVYHWYYYYSQIIWKSNILSRTYLFKKELLHLVSKIEDFSHSNNRRTQDAFAETKIHFYNLLKFEFQNSKVWYLKIYMEGIKNHICIYQSDNARLVTVVPFF